MNFRLFCLILFLGVGLAAADTDEPETPKISKIFGALEKFKSLTGSSFKFLEKCKKHVVDKIKPSEQVVSKLKGFGKKLLDHSAKHLDSLKRWEDNKVIGVFVRPICKQLLKTKDLLEKTVDYLNSDMTPKDRARLNLNDLKDLEDKGPADGFLAKLKEMAKAWIAKKIFH